MTEARCRTPFIVVVAATLTLAGCGGQAALSSPRDGAPSATIDIASHTAALAPTAAPTRSARPAEVTDTMVDIGGGERLHLRCVAGTGPTVILDADLSGDMSEFSEVMPKLPPSMHACAYDREGEGSSSPPAKAGRTSTDIANELHALLGAAHLPAPYVLVGNHFGGLFDLRYAALYPDEISGLVLLDPMLPTAFLRFHSDCAGISSGLNSEAISVCALMNEAGKSALTPPDVPMVILSAADNPGWPADEFAVWMRSHRDLAASVTNGRQQVVQSVLVIPQEQPDATVRAISDVVNARVRP